MGKIRGRKNWEIGGEPDQQPGKWKAPLPRSSGIPSFEPLPDPSVLSCQILSPTLTNSSIEPIQKSIEKGRGFPFSWEGRKTKRDLRKKHSWIQWNQESEQFPWRWWATFVQHQTLPLQKSSGSQQQEGRTHEEKSRNPCSNWWKTFWKISDPNQSKIQPQKCISLSKETRVPIPPPQSWPQTQPKCSLISDNQPPRPGFKEKANDVIPKQVIWWTLMIIQL